MRATFTGTTVGATFTGSNLVAPDDPFTLGTNTGTPTAVFSSVGTVSGSTRGLRITGVAGDQFRFYWAFTSAKTFRIRFPYTPEALMSGTGTAAVSDIAQVIEASTFGTRLTVRHTSANVLQLVDAAGTGVAIPSAPTMVVGTTYWVVLEGTAAATPTATNGTVQARIYVGTSQTAIATYTSAAFNLGTGTGFVRLQFGKTLSATATADFVLDDMDGEIGSAVSYGPVSNSVAPDAGPDQTDIEPFATVQLVGNAGSSPSPTWSQTGGTPTVTLTQTGTNASFVAPATMAGTSLTFRLTDGTLSDTVSIGVDPHNWWWSDGTNYRPLRWSVSSDLAAPVTPTSVVAIDSTSGGRVGAAATSFTWAHVTTASDPSYGVVWLVTNIQNNGAGVDYPEHPVVMWGGVTMTERGSASTSTGGSGTNRKVRCYHLDNPPGGTQTLSVAIPVEAGSGAGNTFAVESIAFTGAANNQTGAATKAGTTTAATSIATPTTTWPAGSMVVSAAVARSTVNLTPGTGMTQLHQRIGGTNIAAVFSSQPASQAIAAASWTTADQGAIMAFPVEPAPAVSTFAPISMPAANTWTDPETGTVWTATWANDFDTPIPLGDARWTVPSNSSHLPTSNIYAVDRSDNAGTAFNCYQPNIGTTSGLGHYDTLSTTWTEAGKLRMKLKTGQNSLSGTVEPLGATFIPRISNTASPSDYWQTFLRVQFRYGISGIVNTSGSPAHYGLVWQMINPTNWPEYGEFDYPEHAVDANVSGFFHPSSILRLPGTPLPHDQGQDTSYPVSPPVAVTAVNTPHTCTLQWEPWVNTSDSKGRLRWWVDDQLCMDRTQYVGNWPMNFMFQAGDNGFLPDPATTATIDVYWCKMWRHPSTVFGGP